MKTYIVYKLYNKITRMSYFGYTSMVTSLSRQQELYRHNKELHNDMLKYGLDNFIKEDIFKTNNLKEALEYESKMIIENNTLWPNGYNHVTTKKYHKSSILRHERMSKATSGVNNPMYGKHHSEETKLKISKAGKGKHWTDEQKKAQSKRLKGRVFSEEHLRRLSIANRKRAKDINYRKKLSESLKGRVFSEEHCRNISRANKGRKLSDKSKQHISEGLKGKVRTEEQKKNYSKYASNRIWYTNGIKNRSCSKDDTEKINLLEYNGFYRGFTSKRRN